MYSKEERIVKNEESVSIDEITNELSLAEEVFTRLSVYSEGFKPRFFTNKDLVNLSITSKSMRSAVFCESNKRETQKLLTHVVRGEQDEAQVMITEKPYLLLIRTEATDYSGRTIIGTAFQAAIGAGDKPMWEMMLPYFECLEQGEALRQFNEQFPNTIEDTPACELQAYYNAIALAIIQNEDKGLFVIEQFRKEITSQNKIIQGKHFNPQHLIAAYQVYMNHFDNFDVAGHWVNKNLFWQKVIGYVLRQMTAYDAQIHCSGIITVLDNEKSFARRLDFVDCEVFFPLDTDTGLGFDFACYSDLSACSMRSGIQECLDVIRRTTPTIESPLEKLFRLKTDALAVLRDSLKEEMYYQPR